MKNRPKDHTAQGYIMVKRISIVLAKWCPHCVPLSLERVQQMAENLKVELRVLDIDDSEQEHVADSLVRAHGDFVEDYLIPQVFFEYEDGSVKHIFTGFSEGVYITKARWDDLMESKLYQQEMQMMLTARRTLGERQPSPSAKTMRIR